MSTDWYYSSKGNKVGPVSESKIRSLAAAGKPQKDCPYCGETILAIAIKCKHCGERLDLGQSQTPPELELVNTHQTATTAPQADAAVAIEYPEIKRTCNRCGNIWFSDSEEEGELELYANVDRQSAVMLGLAGLMGGYGRAGSFSSNDSRQRIEGNAESREDKLAALRRCSKCNSKSFAEIKPPKPDVRGHGKETAASTPLTWQIHPGLFVGIIVFLLILFFFWTFLNGDRQVVAEVGTINREAAVREEVYVLPDNLGEAADVVKELAGIHGDMIKALGSVKDTVSAGVSLPTFEAIAFKVQTLQKQARNLPGASRTLVGNFMGNLLKTLVPMIEKVLALPGVRDQLSPALTRIHYTLIALQAYAGSTKGPEQPQKAEPESVRQMRENLEFQMRVLRSKGAL